MQAFQRDPRFALLCYDPDHRLSSAGEGYLPICRDAGFQSLNQFTDVAFQGTYGMYGVLESIMQPVTPLTAAPPKYQGFARYIGIEEEEKDDQPQRSESRERAVC